MLTARRHEYGTPDAITLEDLPRPVPQGREVLVRVHCTTVNRTDCANLTGQKVGSVILSVR